MIKYLKIMLSRRAEDGTVVDYVENVFDSEDGLTAINQNLFVGSYLLLLVGNNSFSIDQYRTPTQGSLLLLWTQNLQDS